MAAVEASRSDVPFDTAEPVFRFGHGLRYTNSSGNHWLRFGLLDVRRVIGSRTELYFNGPLLSATENHQFDHTAGCCLQRPEQIVHATDWLASRLNDQVAGSKLGTRRWTVVLHQANQHPISIRQSDGAPQSSSDMRWRYADAKPNAPLRLASGQRVHPCSERLVRGNRQVETFAQTVRIQPQQSSVTADYRAAGRAGQQWRIVLDASGDAAAARPSESALNTGDETQGHAQPSPTWIRQCEDRCTDSRRAVGRPLNCLQISGLDSNNGDVSIDIVSRTRPVFVRP
jgi:hypothetical protein